MSSFTVYGLNGHELMPLDRVFTQRGTEKAAAITPAAPPRDRDVRTRQRNREKRSSVQKVYHEIEDLAEAAPAVSAKQIMTVPVTTIGSDADLGGVVARFHERTLRHLPVLDSKGRLIGIVSDRDILRHLAGLGASGRASHLRGGEMSVQSVMKPRVLTAEIDTDVRYIARLFVEQHVGALPIVAAGSLVGIVTRSDVLRAVVRHYALELWA